MISIQDIPLRNVPLSRNLTKRELVLTALLRRFLTLVGIYVQVQISTTHDLRVWSGQIVAEKNNVTIFNPLFDNVALKQY